MINDWITVYKILLRNKFYKNITRKKKIVKILNQFIYYLKLIILRIKLNNSEKAFYLILLYIIPLKEFWL